MVIRHAGVVSGAAVPARRHLYFLPWQKMQTTPFIRSFSIKVEQGKPAGGSRAAPIPVVYFSRIRCRFSFSKSSWISAKTVFFQIVKRLAGASQSVVFRMLRRLLYSNKGVQSFNDYSFSTETPYFLHSKRKCR